MSDLTPSSNGDAQRSDIQPSPVTVDEAPLPPPSSDASEHFAELARPYVPMLVLGPDGFVKHLTGAARRLLQYRSDQEFDAYFFTHVHGKNLHRVMRDLASMVKHGTERASWLLRLRTGRGHWRWYRAEAINRLSFATPAVTVRLRDLHSWQSS